MGLTGDHSVGGSLVPRLPQGGEPTFHVQTLRSCLGALLGATPVGRGWVARTLGLLASFLGWLDCPGPRSHSGVWAGPGRADLRAPGPESSGVATPNVLELPGIQLSQEGEALVHLWTDGLPGVPQPRY